MTLTVTGEDLDVSPFGDELTLRDGSFESSHETENDAKGFAERLFADSKPEGLLGKSVVTIEEDDTTKWILQGTLLATGIEWRHVSRSRAGNQPS